MRREILRICYKYDGYRHLIGMYLAGEDLSAWPGGISGVFLGNALWCISSYDGQNTEEYLGDTIRRTTALNAYGYPQQVRMKRGNSTLRQMNYLYNAVTGNLTQRTSLFLSDDIEYYSYDTSDRLTQWEQDSHAPAMVMEYDYNGNIYRKTNVGQYQYGYDWHHPFAVESVTNAQSLIPSSALSTQFDGRGMVSSIYEYGSWKETTFTYGPDGERWKTVRQAYGEYDVERKYLGDMEITMSGPGMTRCNWYLGHGVMLFRDADNPAFSSVTPLYAFTDNQGSYIDFYRSNGTRVFEAKYDPWGVQTIVTDSIHFHRGYGGHEMLNEFGIINMRSAQRDAFITKWRKNGRLYDPQLGRFLSPDNYVQEPFNTQNLNRYSYCLNNPVKYTDPSGDFNIVHWFAKNTLSGFIKGLFNGEGGKHSAIRQYKNSINLIKGLFATDHNKSHWGRTKELISRFTWQLPQTYLGFRAADELNYYGHVSKVASKYGATAVSSKTLDGFGAATFGNIIIGESSLEADANNSLFQHEYGHYLQSQSLGLAYLIRVGIPSALHERFGGNHNFMNYEQDANMRAFRYFNENVSGFYTSPDEYNTQYNDRNIASQKGEKYRWPKWNFEENPLTLKDKYNLMIWYVDYRNIAPYLSYIGDYKIKFFFK